MNAWNIYIVMQLDSISDGLSFISLLSLSCAAICVIANGLDRHAFDNSPIMLYEGEETDLKEKWASRDKARNKLLAFALPLFFVNMFIPSTKTAAAMVVLPAIANNETIKAEASDLYQLAKMGLQKAAGYEKPSK